MKERYGEEAVVEAKKSLNEGDRLLLERRLLDASWYPLDMLQVFGKLTSKLAKGPAADLSVEIGRGQVRIHRRLPFVAGSNPDQAGSKILLNWGVFLP